MGLRTDQAKNIDFAAWCRIEW